MKVVGIIGGNAVYCKAGINAMEVDRFMRTAWEGVCLHQWDDGDMIIGKLSDYVFFSAKED